MFNFRDYTIGLALKDASKKWGQNEALASKGERVTYKELYRRACMLAMGLNKLGIEKGDLVGTIFGILPEWVYIKYALHIIGAKIVPINVNFRAKELEFILKKTDIKALVTCDKLRYGNYLEILSEIDPEIAVAKKRRVKSMIFPFLESIICFSPGKKKYPYCYDYYEVMDSGAAYTENDIDRLLDRVNPQDICNILFTSGSTAFPKGAMHNHQSLLGIGQFLLGKTLNLNPSHRLLCFLPFYHIGGCVSLTLGSLTSGCCLYLNEFVIDEILPVIQNEKIDFYVGFDAHFNAITNHPKYKEYDLGSITFILLAAGPEWYDKCKKIFPGYQIIAHHYGFTEGTGVSVMPDEKDYKVRKFSNGRPWPGIEIKVVDPITGERVPPNKEGELCLRGWSRFQGYYKNPDETIKAIDLEGYFHTGDYGWIDEDGNVYFRGRYKTMIKSGGENVSEREVEVFLEGIPGVKCVQVIGIPDEKWGEAVTAVIEVEEGANLTQDEVINFCRDKIARFKIPKKVLFISGQDWALLGSGKVDKIALKKWASGK